MKSSSDFDFESIMRNIPNQYSHGTFTTKKHLTEIPEEMIKIFNKIQNNDSDLSYLQQNESSADKLIKYLNNLSNELDDIKTNLYDIVDPKINNIEFNETQKNEKSMDLLKKLKNVKTDIKFSNNFMNNSPNIQASPKFNFTTNISSQFINTGLNLFDEGNTDSLNDSSKDNSRNKINDSYVPNAMCFTLSEINYMREAVKQENEMLDKHVKEQNMMINHIKDKLGMVNKTN